MGANTVNRTARRVRFPVCSELRPPSAGYLLPFCYSTGGDENP